MPYDKITLGNSTNGLICDYVKINQGIATQTEIDTYSPHTYVPTWENNKTILLTQFNENTIDAGNVLNLNGTLTGWQIYRQEIGKSTLDFVRTLGVDVVTTTDYLVATGRTYKYSVFPVTDKEIGARLDSDNIITDWYNWSLTSLKETATENEYVVDQVFIFDLNLQTSDMTNVTDVNVYNGFTQYNKVSRGKRDYLQGTISALMGTMDSNDEYTDSISLRKQLQTFINSSNKKVLKSRKGDMWLIETFNFKYKYMDEISSQPMSMSFDFIQVGDLDISVVNDTSDTDTIIILDGGDF